MICRNCGANIGNGMAYCPYCCASLNPSNTAVTTAKSNQIGILCAVAYGVLQVVVIVFYSIFLFFLLQQISQYTPPPVTSEMSPYEQSAVGTLVAEDNLIAVGGMQCCVHLST